jgi:hypothetical protein
VIEVQETIELPEAVRENAAGQAGEQVTLSPDQVGSQLVLLLQSLLDALPDDTVVFARQALVAQDHSAAASAILFAAIRFRVPISAIEHAVLAECLIGAGETIEMLDYLTVAQEPRPLLFEFVTGPQEMADLKTDTVAPDDGPEPGAAGDDPQASAVDDVVLAAVEHDQAVLGVWRAWRYPVTGAPWPPPRPFYLMEVADDATAVEVTSKFYGPDAPSIGLRDPLVEVYVTDNDVPALHRAVQFSGALVHSGEEERDFIFADVFEGAPGPDGRPQDIVTVDDETAARMLTYLMAGKPLMMADAAGDDLMDPERTGVVPLHLRTDGLWVWSDASAYYLDEHRIAPPADFRSYLAEMGEVPEPVEDVTLHQAVAWLQSE